MNWGENTYPYNLVKTGAQICCLLSVFKTIRQRPSDHIILNLRYYYVVYIVVMYTLRV